MINFYCHKLSGLIESAVSYVFSVYFFGHFSVID